jgi:site-specific recombinase XerD
VERWTEQHGTRCSTTEARRKIASTARNPVEQMLRLAVPDFCGRRRARWARAPFEGRAGGFFAYLVEERGLRQPTVLHYKHHLGPFEAYLDRIACRDVAAISPLLLDAFVVESAGHLCPTSVRDRCGVLRVFLRYLHRERLIARDLSVCVEVSRRYRLSGIPRSIAWDDVRRMLWALDSISIRNAQTSRLSSTT